MGRAGWGIMFMTLISLAVATAGLFNGDNMGSVISETGLDKLYSVDNYSVGNSDTFDSTAYDYVEGENPLSVENNDYYVGSWSFTKTFLTFFKDFFTPASVLKTVSGMSEFPNVVILWVLNIIWGVMYALLFFEIIWRFNIFD